MDGFAVAAIESGQFRLIPADEKIERYVKNHQGEFLTISIHAKGRDKVRHDQFFAIMTRAVHNLRNADGSEMYRVENWKDEEAAIEDLRVKLCYAIGYVKTTIGLDGKEKMSPKSIDFTIPEDIVESQFRVPAYNTLASLLGCRVRDLFSCEEI